MNKFDQKKLFQSMLSLTFCLGTALNADFVMAQKNRPYSDPAAEAAIEEAIATGYSVLGRMNKLTRSVSKNGNAITIVPADVVSAGCGDAVVGIGNTTVSPDGDVPDEVTSTNVVLGDVISINLGCE